jgi:hypothetical protein
VAGKAPIEQVNVWKIWRLHAFTHFLTFSLSPLLLSSATLRAADDPLPKFLGAQSCASSSCHGGADEKRNQFMIWSKRDFHTRAPATLNMARSARIAETLKIKDATSEARCTVCHNPFQSVSVERKGPLAGKLEGVSCESCHNAAEPWLLTHTRTDLKYEEKIAAGMRDLKHLYVRANTCVACHQNLEPELRAAGHPELTFELDGQCVSMPRHWSETNRARGAQAWEVGQMVALREAAAQAGAAKATDDIKNRASALAWLSGLPMEIAAADQAARATADKEWTADQVEARLVRLVNTSEAFTRSDVSKEEQAYRAERLVLGLERALVALKVDKDLVFTVKLDQLFKDVQSRPDFEPKKFAEHLKDFATEWEKVSSK